MTFASFGSSKGREMLDRILIALSRRMRKSRKLRLPALVLAGC
ncbi:hypothetical protein AKJ09_03053 [Labilithrix luteola]|uniref:Uncharacterized protein n=1 Tax=Labilithrix luteola TaxID=1391654 RepID=A0A0K1PTC9_9BACT|nr:hypothetical protein AKJ09_03053 [Labilithrix luteola]